MLWSNYTMAIEDYRKRQSVTSLHRFLPDCPHKCSSHIFLSYFSHISLGAHESVRFRGGCGHCCGRVARLAARHGLLDVSSLPVGGDGWALPTAQTITSPQWRSKLSFSIAWVCTTCSRISASASRCQGPKQGDFVSGAGFSGCAYVGGHGWALFAEAF
jgi:hypothetical protein